MRERVTAMRDALRHRGPDDAGLFVDAEAGVALGHRRLSVLDLSPLGHQPMASPSGRYQLVYNGEIYNFLELRSQLEGAGFGFRGGSDTEVLLAAVEHWGPEDALQRCNGMFALALWDREGRRILLARDRFGKKPLYFARLGNSWVFASELKSFRPWNSWIGGQLDPAGLAAYFQFGYVPAPHTIYQGIWKLPEASLVWLDAGDDYQVRRYWRFPGASRSTSLEDVEAALLRSVKLRMVADVPLGAFLSGGIDSSLLVACMQEQSTRPIQTFTLGFQEASHDEAGYAKAIAQRLGTDHAEHYLQPSEALQLVPELTSIYDEPFADPSQIPTYLVCRMARQRVTVALSGDGGDEIFGGYNRYLQAPRVWRALSRLPWRVRKLLSMLVSRFPVGLVSSLFTSRVAYPEEKLSKLIQALPVRSPGELYQNLAGQWFGEAVLRNGRTMPVPAAPQQADEFVEWMMRQDIEGYLVDDVLVKVDRASMAVSLETRAPFLDFELAELAAGLPLEDKIRDGKGKWVLRQLLRKRLPEELLARPKAGFSPPLGAWLRGPLRGWADDLLSSVERQGLLRPEPLRRRWREHVQGRRNWGYQLWTVLTFQSWLEHSPLGQ